MNKLTTTEFNKIKKLLEKFSIKEIVDNKLSDKKYTTINCIKRSSTFEEYKLLSQKHIKKKQDKQAPKNERVLVLKRCIQDNKAYNGFVYTEVGTTVEASDWKDNKECGNGLHGWTENNWQYYDNSLQGNWVVLEVNKVDGFVDLDDKVKFRKGKVLYNNKELQGAKDIILKEYPNFVFHNDAQTAGGSSTQTAGDYSTQTAGDISTQTAGGSSTQTAGYLSTQTAGGSSTQTAGGSSTQTAGAGSTQTAGDNSFICHYVFDGYINTVTAGKNTSITSINIDTGKSNTFINKIAGTTYKIGGDCKAKKVKEV